MASKIVVTGDINGQFDKFFAKLTELHKKQNFAFAIIAGNLFSEGGDDDDEQLSRLLNDEIVVPLPTYFSVGRQQLPTKAAAKLKKTQGELSSNLSLLDRTVSLKTSEGFRLVHVGGTHSEDQAGPLSQYDAKYRDEDAQTIIKGTAEADILLTSEWPAGVQIGSKADYTDQPIAGVQCIADLAGALKPRYHFSASPAFYEREPFFHNGPPPRSVTRFISLAPFGNAKKQKWIYAFSLEPSAAPPQTLPPGCTASPFTSTKKRKLEPQEDEYNNFRYSNGNGNGNGHYEHDRGGRNKRRRNQPPPTPDQCFFCLSNENCESHMVASIGGDVYLTTSKGPLTLPTTFPELGFPGHILIIPVAHTPTISAIVDVEERERTVKEMQQFRAALDQMLVDRSKDDSGRSKLGSVTWEISRASGVHLHWQYLPIPVDMIQKGLVEAGFDVEAENSSYPKFVKDFKAMEEVESGDFFKVMIWSESLRKEMVMPLDGGFRFDLQFGRRVLGKLLGLEKRTHWRDCPQTKAEEEVDCQKFKAAFKEYDFSD